MSGRSPFRTLRRLMGGVGFTACAGLGTYYYATKPPPCVLDPTKVEEDVDCLIIGGGIMGATVAVMLKLLEPEWKVKLVEQQNRVGQEASNEWHNAGTGHAALCEPNYTPWAKGSSETEIDITKAVKTNEKFMTSLAFWSFLVEKHILPDANFIQPAPHITFVHGDGHKKWLKARVAALTKLPAFAATEYSEDFEKIQRWSSLLCKSRQKNGEVIAASRHPDGTEVNYGLLTRNLVQSFTEIGGDLQLLSRVSGLKQQADKRWLVGISKDDLSKTNQTIRARYVFAGAGGGALPILQQSGIPEIKGYGGMPVSGKFLVCQKKNLVEENLNKVYGPAGPGAPPMSVPHLDFRSLYGKDVIFFGPFAGFSPMLFKNMGTPLDWLETINTSNIVPMIKMGYRNLPLVKYLVGEIVASKESQLDSLRHFYPGAKPDDWTMVWAGQRIQIVNPNGDLQFGTQVMSNSDGTMIGLLGASPGASVSPQIAIEVLNKLGPIRNFNWHLTLCKWIPSLGQDINEVPGLYESVMGKAKKVLLQGETCGYRSSHCHTAHLFDAIDKNHDGELSIKELKEFLSSEGMAKGQVKSLVKALDVDGDGHISRSEFERGFGKLLSGLLHKTSDDV